MYHCTSFSKKSLAIAAMAFSCCFASSAYACSDDAYLGTMCVTAGSYCPRDYTEAAGQTIAINTNTALYSILGSIYGGDDRTYFKLPDLRGRSMVSLGLGPGLSPVAQGQYRGQETVTQSIIQMPPHTHTATVTGGGGGGPVNVTLEVATNSGTGTPQTGDYLGAGGTGQGQAAIYVNPSSVTGTVTLGGITATGGGGSPGVVTIGNTGGGYAMSNLPPQLGMRACIKTTGIYPPRN